jgi:signal transduction histidine kinase
VGLYLHSPERALAPRVDFAKGLASVVQEFRDTNPQAQLIDELTISGVVTCDLSRLQQLLSNLIANANANAIAYGVQGTPILIRAFIDNGEAVLSVANQGAVIAQVDLDRSSILTGAQTSRTKAPTSDWGYTSVRR